jgi:hypothetical protein
MKKILLSIIALTFLMAPSGAHAATYTCSNTALAPITVTDPSGAGASTVSDFNAKCINAGGVSSGPTSQQLYDQAQLQSGGAGNQTIGRTPTSFSMGDCLAQNNNDVAGCQRLLDQYNQANQTQLDTSNTTGLLNQDQYSCPTGQTYSNVNGTPGCVPMPTIPTPTQPAYTPQTVQPANTGSARLTYTPLEPLKGSDMTPYNSLPAYLALVFNILLSIGATIAIVTIVISGITYMVSEVVNKKAEARRRMLASVIGLLLLLTCWLILNTINPNLVNLALIIPGSPATAQPQGAGQPGVYSSATAAGSTAPTLDQIKTCEGYEVPTGKHFTYNNGSGWVCQ